MVACFFPLLLYKTKAVPVMEHPFAEKTG